MNKNSLIGFVLIGAILILFAWYNSKKYNEQAAPRQITDTLSTDTVPGQQQPKETDTAGTAVINPDAQNLSGGKLTSPYRDTMLQAAEVKPEEFVTLDNGRLAITFTNRGAQPRTVKIHNYYTYDSLDLNLIRENKSSFDLRFFTSQEISTKNFSFDLFQRSDTSLIYRLYVDSVSFVEFSYTLPAEGYMLDFKVRFSSMKRHLSRSTNMFDIEWMLDLPRLEKGYDNEKNYSSVLFRYPNSNEVENLGLRKESSEKDVRTKLSWVAFQQQFFSAILVAENNFNSGLLNYNIFPENDPDRSLMHCKALVQAQYPDGDDVVVPFKYYFGPNHFKTLKSYDLGFEKIVPLGGWLIGWINRYVIILVFDLLSKFIGNYGIIILLLTILIKLVISPLTIKSYISSAKMRVLKPEVDKINAKYPKQEDAMKKQQETMALYQKTGISMFGGCLPMLFQFPILFAMFKFFPASFELRQQGFLWATDLSAYDSVLNLPFTIPLYGDHVSLFALLMAISMFFYSKLNADQMSTGPQMAGMKLMTIYFMPVFLLVFCNNLSSGLSYYYMLSNLFTILQTWVIRKYFVDEKKLYAQLKEKAASNAPKKKSKFQERLDAAYKAQQEQLKKRK
ncbi:MAG: membrane protein insertase YidC [Bacteroidales bacterium]|nr:membrane protein insertase YidC [Bacteroidales bacterium]MDD2425594.1 membrane protein insertase YidC [Bacteroidales bacterium]MDD3988867.1 membrane protein insertase YidC [Bacteroidales bacterium]MDD4639142.1 membrane protein insertase YidC [Bacteroidales bacterium]